MRNVFVWFGAMLFLLSCQNQQPSNSSGSSSLKQKESIDIQGHRGARGHYPENSLDGFILALNMGVSTLEMDAVITKDNQVVLSHEPWLSAGICSDKEGRPIEEKEAQSFNIYEMTYDELSQYTCGGRGHPRFPDQTHSAETKPLLSEVIDSVESYVKIKGMAAPAYNIETKSSTEGDGVFHPAPEEFVRSLIDVIQSKNVLERSTIQSFDIRTLQEIAELRNKKEIDARLSLALLVGQEDEVGQKLESLGFIPEIYSPNYALIDSSRLQQWQEKGMKVIPWTVNEKEDMIKLLDMGVDGIISDYPDRVVQVLENRKSAGEEPENTSL